MVEFLSRDLLRRETGRFPINEEATVRRASGRSPEGATFLSHSSADADRLPYVIALLERHGAVVYVDKKDQTLPAVTSRETASQLKRRIRLSNKFVLLTSPTSKDSRWMPWELGVADGYKGGSKLAILPSPEHANEQRWADQEYLGVYDRIVYGRHASYKEQIFMVWDEEDNTATELGEWLRS